MLSLSSGWGQLACTIGIEGKDHRLKRFLSRAVRAEVAHPTSDADIVPNKRRSKICEYPRRLHRSLFSPGSGRSTRSKPAVTRRPLKGIEKPKWLRSVCPGGVFTGQ